MSVLAIDFDDVLMDPRNVKPGFRMGEPMYGAQDAMESLHQAGHTLIIHTVRGDKPKHVEDWLRHFHIPFQGVTNVKMAASAYIDNNGLRFVSWEQVLGEIR